MHAQNVFYKNFIYFKTSLKISYDFYLIYQESKFSLSNRLRNELASYSTKTLLIEQAPNLDKLLTNQLGLIDQHRRLNDWRVVSAHGLFTFWVISLLLYKEVFVFTSNHENMVFILLFLTRSLHINIICHYLSVERAKILILELCNFLFDQICM